MNKIITWLKSHILISIIIGVGIISGITGAVVLINKDKTVRKFTGEYKEFIYCEDEKYYLNKDNKTCQKMEKVDPINKYRKICPEGYSYEVDDEVGDRCVRVVDVKDAIVYNMPIYETTKEKELPGVTCGSRAGGTAEKDMCSYATYYAETLLSNKHDEFYYEGGEIKWNSLGYPAKCNSINITEENIVITKCTVTDAKIIRKYESDELYVATLRTGRGYYGNYKYEVGISPTWEEAVKIPLSWYKSH